MRREESRTSVQPRTRSSPSASFRSSSNSGPRDGPRGGGFERIQVLKEYAAALSDDDLKYLHLRLEHRFHGDLPEAFRMLQRSEQVDLFLAAAGSCEDFMSRVDTVGNHVRAEYHRRLGR